MRRSDTPGRVVGRSARTVSPKSRVSRLGRKKMVGAKKEPQLLSVAATSKPLKPVEPYEVLASSVFIDEMWVSLKNALSGGPSEWTSEKTRATTVLRARPIREGTKYAASELSTNEDGSISIADPVSKEKGRDFSFDHVFNESKRTSSAGKSSQTRIFEHLAPRILTAVWKGQDATVVAVGDKGSGKTHTIFGSSIKGEKDAGMIPRFAASIFSLIKKDSAEHSGTQWTICVSAYIIRKDDITDLLPTQNPTLERPSQARRTCSFFEREGIEAQVVGVERQPISDYNGMVRVFENISIARTLDASVNSKNCNVFVEFRLSRCGAPIRATTTDDPKSALDNIEDKISSTVSFVEVCASVKKNTKQSCASILEYVNSSTIGNRDTTEKTLRLCARLLPSRDFEPEEKLQTFLRLPWSKTVAASLLKSKFSGSGHVTLMACIHAVQQEHLATTKRLNMVTAYGSILEFSAKSAIMAKKDKLKRLRETINELEEFVNASTIVHKEYNGKEIERSASILFQMKKIYDMETEVIERVKSGNEIENDNVSHPSIPLPPSHDRRSSITARSGTYSKSIVGLIELRESQAMAAKDNPTSEDLQKLAHDRFTNRLIFLCSDPVFCSRVELEIPLGHTRVTGIRDPLFEDLGRQVVLELLPQSEGPTCDFLNLDGAMTVTRRHRNVLLLLNGVEILHNEAKTLALGDRLVIGTHYFLLVSSLHGKGIAKDAGLSSAPMASPKGSAKPSSPRKPESSLSARNSPSSKSPTKVVSAKGRGKSLAVMKSYEDVLNEWLLAYAKISLNEMEKKISEMKSFSLPGAVENVSDTPSSDDEDISFEKKSPAPLDKTAMKLPTKKSTPGKTAAAKTGAKPPRDSKSAPSLSHVIASASLVEPLVDMYQVLNAVNKMAREMHAHVIFQLYQMSPVLSERVVGRAIKEDYFVVGITTGHPSSIFCMCTRGQLTHVVSELKGFMSKSRSLPEGQSDEEFCSNYFYSTFSYALDFLVGQHKQFLKYKSDTAQLEQEMKQLREMNDVHESKILKHHVDLQTRENGVEEMMKNHMEEVTQVFVRCEVDNLVAQAAQACVLEAEKTKLKETYESTIEKFYEAARHAVLEKQGVESQLHEARKSLISLQKSYEAQGVALRDARISSIKSYSSKEQLLHDFFAYSRSRASDGSSRRPKDSHRITPGKSRRSPGHVIKNERKSRSKSVEREHFDNVQWRDDHGEKLELLSKLAEHEQTIKRQNLHIGSLQRGLGACDANQQLMTGQEQTGARDRSVFSTRHVVPQPSLDSHSNITGAINAFGGAPPSSHIDATLPRDPSSLYPTMEELIHENKRLRTELQLSKRGERSRAQAGSLLQGQLESKDAIIAELRNENNGLQHANQILQKQVASHFEKIKKISRCSVDRKELDLVMSYIEHIDEVLVSNEGLFDLSFNGSNTPRVSTPSNLVNSRSTPRLAHQEKIETRKIRNDSRRISERKPRTSIPNFRQQIGREVSESIGNYMQETEEPLRTPRKSEFSSDSNNHSARPRSSNGEKRMNQSTSAVSSDLWTKLWAWKESEDQRKSDAERRR